MPVRSVLYLQPKPGCRQALIDAFRRIDVIGHAMEQEGCLGVEMLAPDDSSAALAVIALWTGREGIDGWDRNPWRAESTTELDQLIEQEPVRAVYDIVLASQSVNNITGEETTT
jgi:quinol monooxygenase YgiN